MNQNKNITFRRIKGRIIPIRLNKSQKEQAKGAGIATAGLGVAAAGGKIYKAAVTKAATLSFKGFARLEKIFDKVGPAQLSFDDLARRNKANKSAVKALKAGKRLANVSKGIRVGAVALGAGLIGYGTAKYLNNLNEKQKKKIDPEIASGGIAALAVLSPSIIKKAQKSFEVGLMSKQTALKFSSFLKKGL